ncbi:mono/diheme cytochrome c family protein [Sinorhizobium fredii]|uniref:Gluconate 2-dehydrogenase cytochrome c subunit n=1 Tax=Sinorhizobium fredii (strain USDA 257) TaxID=1185652 RepID=I3XCS8_SINF2|nr:cytochrome c [Sinorhizobium fredii]AFL53684.1 gluconate 2-dehydrogenase cytochrome c subunit [Sinorhizobium fredii USDA 257]
MWAFRAAILFVAAIFVAAVAFFVFAWRSEIPEEEVAAEASFSPELVAKGAQLAALGNCIACHTVPGKPAFTGGLALPTPFGTIHSTNITPDRETGIGGWSEAAFERAMRDGVDREGNHLYPAFPYDHFTRVSAEDTHALYAFLMTRVAVRAEAPKNDLPFPLKFRPLLAGWKLLFFDRGELEPDSAQSEAWNRGRYLAEGLGHCGACHTPRNAFGAEYPDRHFGGGEAEGWQAYAINRESKAPIPWDEQSLAFYLRNGWHEFHGVSRGPMAEVTGNLSLLPDSDIAAIATYVTSITDDPTPERSERAARLREQFEGDRLEQIADSQSSAVSTAGGGSGEAIYLAACASCHEGRRRQPFGGLNFELSTAVNAPNPQNIVNVVLFGLPPADGEASAVMPAFRHLLNDQQVTDVLAYMRERFSEEPPWSGLGEQVANTRSGAYKVTVRPSDGIERAPHNVGAEEE